MEVMAFLIGAAARLAPSSAKAAITSPVKAEAAESAKDAHIASGAKDWPGHWAVTRYL